MHPPEFVLKSVNTREIPKITKVKVVSEKSVGVDSYYMISLVCYWSKVSRPYNLHFSFKENSFLEGDIFFPRGDFSLEDEGTLHLNDDKNSM